MEMTHNGFTGMKTSKHSFKGLVNKTSMVQGGAKEENAKVYVTAKRPEGMKEI
jgi:hypothetical protein